MSSLEPSRYFHAARIGVGLALRNTSLLGYVREEAYGNALEELVKRSPATFGAAVLIARNAAIDEVRTFTDWNRSKRKPTRTPVNDSEETLAGIGTSETERAVLAAERWDRAARSLDDRSLTILTRTVEGFTLAEIGSELGVTYSRVSQLRTAAFKVLHGSAN